MAEKGFMLTQFEECFGMTCDHETIKIILQSVDWDPVKAIEAIKSVMGMQSIPGNVSVKIDALIEHYKVENVSANSATFPSTGNVIFDQRKNFKNKNAASAMNSLCMFENSQSNLDNPCNIWSQQKNFKSNNSNFNHKVNNVHKKNSFTNNQGYYGSLLSDASHLNKGTSVSRENVCKFSSSDPATLSSEKATCNMNLMKVMLEGGTLVMVIIRGMPGSGKSTLACKLTDVRGIVLSTDDFFIASNGMYNYNHTKISEAHQWNQQRTQSYLYKKVTPIIIDNTNLQKWEMEPYVMMALKCNYKVEFIEPDTPWKYDSSVLARKTRHGVPHERIVIMLSRFEKNVKLKDFRFAANCTEKELGFNHTMPKLDNDIANSFQNLKVVNICGNTNDTNFSENKNINNIDKSDLHDIHIPRVDLKETLNSVKLNLQIDYQVESRDSSPEGIDSDTFDDIVQSLGTEVRKQMNKTAHEETTSSDSLSKDTTTDDINEDLQMYKFCEDVEDKLGNSISALIRPQLKGEDSKDAVANIVSNLLAEPTTSMASPIHTNIKLIKAPQLDTVTEELSKDLLSSVRCNEVNNEGSTNEDTSDDASSVELIKDDSDVEVELVETIEPVAPMYMQPLSSWNCTTVEVATCNLDIDKKIKTLTINEPLPSNVEEYKQINLTTNIDNSTAEQSIVQVNDVTERCITSDMSLLNVDAANLEDDYDAKMSLLRKTGAVPKQNRERHRPPKKLDTIQNCKTYVNISEPVSKYALCEFENVSPECVSILDISPTWNKVDSETQTELDTVMKQNDLKVLYGNMERFVLSPLLQLSSEGPITKGRLMLEKGTMTDAMPEQVGSVDHLKVFFPTVCEDELQDILSKCNDDVDWAMNILLDGGYVISESPSHVSSDCSSDSVKNRDSCEIFVSDSSEFSGSSHSAEDSPCHSKGVEQKKKRKSKKSKSINGHGKCNATEMLISKADFLSDNERQVSPMPVPNGATSPCFRQLVTNKTSTMRMASPKLQNVSGEKDKLEDCQNVTMDLDLLFAYQLINIFGPVGNLDLNHKFSENERRVLLPLSLCKEIHKFWNSTIENNTKYDDDILESYIKADSVYAHQLHEEEMRAKNSNSPAPSHFSSFDDAQPPTFLREIMNLEKALQLSSKKEPRDDIAMQLSEKKLCEEFKHVDRTAVCDILMACNGNYEAATTDLLLKFGITGGSAAGVNKHYGQDAASESMDDAKQLTDMLKQKENNFKHDMDLMYGGGDQDVQHELQRCRDEYDLYHGLRKELLEKVKQASGAQAHIVAQHYARQATNYSSHMYALQVRSSSLVLRQHNRNSDANTLDLHMLQVPAAVSACENFLNERRRALNANASIGEPKKLTLVIITGWGRHSSGGKGRLKPAIKNFLTKHGYKYCEGAANPGMLLVSLAASL